MNENIYKQLKSVELDKAKKGKFSYASWSDVWETVINFDDKAIYEVGETEGGFPAFINSTGGIVKVKVTIKGLSRTQWLPIMDFRNQSIPKDKITTMDINKTIQRCLVKCVALFGLGLYIYKGEDLPPTPSIDEV